MEFLVRSKGVVELGWMQVIARPLWRELGTQAADQEPAPYEDLIGIVLERLVTAEVGHWYKARLLNV